MTRVIILDAFDCLLLYPNVFSFCDEPGEKIDCDVLYLILDFIHQASL